MKLISCPTCHRQHNASGLEPTSRIRCICDTILTAGEARELTVRGLVCKHCGAPCGPDSAACKHCSAALSELDRKATLLCPKCGVRLPDESKICNGCAIELRPQALAAMPEKAKCPRCKEAMQLRILGEFNVIECTGCAGLWFDPKGFEAVCQRAEENSLPSINPSVAEQEAAPLPKGSPHYLRCIYCTHLMQRRSFRSKKGNSGVVIDRCPKHGIWLDHMELEAIVAFLRSESVLQPTPEEKKVSKIPSLERTKDMLGVPRRTNAPNSRRSRERRSDEGTDWGDFFEVLYWLSFWHWS